MDCFENVFIQSLSLSSAGYKRMLKGIVIEFIPYNARKSLGQVAAELFCK